MSAKLIKGAEPSHFSVFIPSATPSADDADGETPAPHAPHSRGAATTTAAPVRAAEAAGYAVTPGVVRAAPEMDAATAHHEAAVIIAAAQAEADRLIAEAQSEAAAIEHAARAEGLAEGRGAAAGEVAQAVEPLRERLTQVLEEISTLHETIAAHAERDLVRLAIEIAKKIVHREVTTDHEIALTLARVALARLHDRAVATVHLHPEDYNYVHAHSEQLGAGGSIEIVEDRSIGRGGCLVRTEMGDIDARIEQQFAEIERGFLSH